MILGCTTALCQEWKEQVDDFLSVELSKFNVPDMEVLIVNKDAVLYSKSIGKSTPNASYYIGSVSKSLTAFGVLKLIEQKKLSFDTKLVDLIPEIRLSNSQEKITVWHLLTHTSGIKKKSGFKYLPALKELEAQKFKVNNNAIEPLRHEYSNLNYSLLGLIIERTTGLSFEDYMHKNVFETLKMNNTKTGSRDGLSAQLIDHYQYFGPFPVKSKQVDFAESSIPAGFISSSSADLAKYIQLNLSEGKLHNKSFIDSSLLNVMHTVWDKGEYGYAMGWKQGRYNDYKFYQHLGTTANSYSGVFFIPEKELGFVFLTNSNSLYFSESIAEGILNILTGGQQKEVSKFELFLRTGVLIGYLLIIGNFLYKLLKGRKNNYSVSRSKQVTNLIVHTALLIALFLVFPVVAQIPFISFLKMQPDIGFLILLSLAFPLVLAIIRTYKTNPVGNKG
jgi:CubicO group peptidase (beta-lactamase class C family)